MMGRWRLKLNNGWAAIAALLGVGLLPCPDCGAPLAVHTWPIALLIWVFQRIRRQQARHPDLYLEAAPREPPAPPPGEAGSGGDDVPPVS